MNKVIYFILVCIHQAASECNILSIGHFCPAPGEIPRLVTIWTGMKCDVSIKEYKIYFVHVSENGDLLGEMEAVDFDRREYSKPIDLVDGINNFKFNQFYDQKRTFYEFSDSVPDFWMRGTVVIQGEYYKFIWTPSSGSEQFYSIYHFPCPLPSSKLKEIHDTQKYHTYEVDHLEPESGLGLPTMSPTVQPSETPSGQPTGVPSAIPSTQPTAQPSSVPSSQPTTSPSSKPSGQPTGQPTDQPTGQPTDQPTGQPTDQPTGQPTDQPTGQPTDQPTAQPTGQPTGQPSAQPSAQPSSLPSSQPSGRPTAQPSAHPTGQPTSAPSPRPCSACSSGQYYDGSCKFQSCKTCPLGYYCPGGCEDPTPCPTGSYNPSYGAAVSSKCLACERGYYSAVQGSATCYSCAAGYACKNATAYPEPCKKGYYSIQGSSTCSACPAGTYASRVGSSACSTCPAGFACLDPTASNVKLSCNTLIHR